MANSHAKSASPKLAESATFLETEGELGDAGAVEHRHFEELHAPFPGEFLSPSSFHSTAAEVQFVPQQKEDDVLPGVLGYMRAGVPTSLCQLARPAKDD